MMRPAGFEPALLAWEARVLAKLDHGRSENKFVSKVLKFTL